MLRFRLYAFVEAAVLPSIVLRYAGAPIATRASFSFSGDVAFSEYFLYHFRFLFVWRVPYVVRSFLSNVFFFNFLTTGWIFYISLCEICKRGRARALQSSNSATLPLKRRHQPMSRFDSCRWMNTDTARQECATLSLYTACRTTDRRRTDVGWLPKFKIPRWL